MAHHASRSVYQRLADRLDRFPQGAPPSESLYRILSVLVSEEEAARVACLPIRPFTAEKAASIWKVDLAEARRTLDALASRALLLDVEIHGQPRYVLPPPMAGFFEFSLMRVRTDVDQRVLAELFQQYLNVEEDFVRALFTRGETRLGRAFVHEPALPADDTLEVLDWERASSVVRTATSRGVGLCYCRHKMEHLGKACDAPRSVCLTLNGSAFSLIRHGHARSVDAEEAVDVLRQSWEHGLVQFGENVREEVNFICNCCGCCCEALLAARRFAADHPIQTTPFLPGVDEARCTGCGRCVRACPVEAVELARPDATGAPPTPSPSPPLARVDPVRCLGCGLCVRACRAEAITLHPRGPRTLTPRDTAHRAVLMAVERGTLAEMIVDQHLLERHRALTALVAAILDLPPVKRLLALRQVRSRYLDAVARWWMA